MGMDKKTQLEWAAERRSYEKIFAAVTGKKTRVLSIENPAEGVGYTTEDGRIFLAYDDDLFDGLSKEEKMIFRKGIFVHEMLHQMFTNFNATSRTTKLLPSRERGVFAMLSNVLEDPAIEYWASTVVGGHLMVALKYAISKTYQKTPPINDAKTPFGQYVNALINFGDMGLIKGNFTFDIAKEIFLKTAPLFAEGIEEPSGKKRVSISKDIFELSRPLWEEEVKNQEEFEQMMQDLLDQLAKNGKSIAKGSGTGSTPDDESASSDEKKSARRKITLKKISKEEMEEMFGDSDGSGGGSGELPDGDITVYYSDEDTGGSGSGTPLNGDIIEESSDENGSDKNGSGKEKSKDGSENGEPNGNGDGEGNGESDGNGESNGDGESKEGSSDSKNTDSSKPQKNSDSRDGDFVGHHTGEKRPNQKIQDITEEDICFSDEKNTVGDITEEEYTLTEADIDYIIKEAEERLKDYENEMNEAEQDTTSLEDLNISSPKLGHRSCLNYRMTYESRSVENLESSYQTLMTKLGPGIKSTVVQLKKIFEQDFEDKEYKSSGKININRLNSGRVTSRIFDKRRAPTGKSDIAVFLLVDESGSMSCSSKYVAASESCIALAEVFDKLHVDTYVMGFTADTQGHDVVHNHYLTWKNTHAERLKLLNIDARANNLDGYSVRYATEILKKANAKNKLLIVLSDGQPAAYNYSNGVADTKDAIRDAKKHVSVLGVAIGNSDTETIHYMYQKDFLHINNVKDLFSGVSKKIRDIVRGWE